MKRITIPILIVLAAAAAAFADAPIRLRSAVTVDAADVLLADLVGLADRDRLPERAESLVVASAPSVGGEIEISAAQLRSRLDHAGVATQDLAIPAAVRVRRASQTVSEETIRDAVRVYVARNIPWHNLKHEVAFTGPIQTVTAAPGSVQIAVRPGKRSDLVGRVPFEIEVSSAGEVVRRLWISTEVHVYASAWKCAKNMRKFHALGEADLVPVKVDLAAAPSGVILDRSDLLGKRMRRTVTAGAVLTRRMVEMPPTVARGDVVTIVLASGPMTIKVLGEVVRDAREGDRVRVKNMQTERVVYARVLDRNTVVVDF